MVTRNRVAMVVGGLAALLAASACEPVPEPPDLGPAALGPVGGFVAAEPGAGVDGTRTTDGFDLVRASRFDLRTEVWLERRSASGAPLGAPRRIDSHLDEHVPVAGGEPAAASSGDVTLAAVQQRPQQGTGELVVLATDAGGDVTRHAVVACPGATFRFDGVAATWNGTTFVVAAACTDAIRLYRATTAGQLTAAGSVPVAAGEVELSSAGGTSLLVYDRAVSGAGKDVVGQRLTAAGAPTGAPLTIAGGAGDQADPAVAASGGTHLVVWERPGLDVAAREVSPAGALGAVTTVVDAAQDQRDPDVAGIASGAWQVVWRDLRDGDEPNGAWGARVSATGTVAPADGRRLDGQRPDLSGPFVTGVAGGTSAVVVDHAYGRLLDTSGAPGARRILSRQPIEQVCPDVGMAMQRDLVVWTQATPAGGFTSYARVLQDGAPVGATLALAPSATDARCPRVASDGTRWLVVWEDRQPGTSDVRGAFVSASGTVSPVGGFAIGTGPGIQDGPEVAFDGTRFVVAWRDLAVGFRIKAMRIAVDGTVLDPAGLLVGTQAQRPDVASRSGMTAIAWGDKVRLLRSNGSFATDVRDLGVGESFESADLAAGPDGFVRSMETQLVLVGATTGEPVRSLDLDEGPTWWSSLAYDGTSFLFFDTNGLHDWLRRITPDLTAASDPTDAARFSTDSRLVARAGRGGLFVVGGHPLERWAVS
jgi:hypothetical protein